MPYINKNILCTTAITAILNLSFQPAYAVKIEPIISEEMADSKGMSHHLTLKDLDQDKSTAPSASASWMPELVKEAGSYSLTAIKGLVQLPRLASKGIIYAVNHPMEALTLGLTAQVTTVTALNAKRQAVGDEFKMNQYPGTGLYQGCFVPSITSLTNEIFLVWMSDTNGDISIYGGVFSQTGPVLQNTDFKINQNTSAIQSLPSVARLTNGNVFVAWEGYLNGLYYNSYGRIFSLTGTPSSQFENAVTNEFEINQNTTYNNHNPSVASLTNGDVFVAWDGNDYQNANRNNIYGGIISQSGTPQSGDFDINQITGYNMYNPSVVSLQSGNVFVAWGGRQTGNANIYGRIFSSNGGSLSNEFLISQNQNTMDGDAKPSVASLTNGNVFVAWERQHETGTMPYDYDIYGRIFSSTGTPVNNEFTINQNASAIQKNPSVASLTNGNVFVAWNGDQTGDYDIYGRGFLADGTAITNEFTINQGTTTDQENPSVASLTNGNVFVAWNGLQTGNYNIYGRSIDLSNFIATNTPTSQITSPNPTSSSVSTTTGPQMTSSPQTGGQPAANEATSQSLSTWLAGAALIIGQERL